MFDVVTYRMMHTLAEEGKSRLMSFPFNFVSYHYPDILHVSGTLQSDSQICKHLILRITMGDITGFFPIIIPILIIRKLRCKE